jgi:PAS domain S-box-containing protein
MKPPVLIIDDSRTVRMDLHETFESAGFDVTGCETLAASRDALARQSFALIVLDVLLPDGDGIDLLRDLKSRPATAGVPVILLSTEAEVRDRVRGLQTGADDYVGKPYDTAHVLARARQLLGAGKQTPANPAPTLLLVDDSATFRHEFRAVLESRGYRVVTAENGEDGLRTAVATRPSGIIVDGILPGGMDGAAVIQRMKQDVSLRDTPCLLLTAADTPGDELRALEVGADAYVHKGTDVEIILARILALLRSAAAPAPADSSVSSLLGPKRILAVDDSPTYLHRLADELRTEGYDVILASSGREAIELLEVQPADCILLDLLMPGMSGQETCQVIKKRLAWRNIPLVILTAVPEAEAMVDGINAGADDYVSKSSDFEVLKARVRAQLRRRQMEDEERSIREQLLQKEHEAVSAKAAQEVAEAKAAIQPLLRNEVWLNTVTRMAHVGGWDWNIPAKTMIWSDEQYRIFGLEPAGLQPTYETFLHALDPEDRDRVIQAWDQSLGRQKPLQVECRIARPSGEIRHVVCLGEVCETEAGRPLRMVGTVLDITERKNSEESLARHAAELARSNAELQRFAYVASHDLQEPLRMVASFTQLLGKRYRGKLDANADEFIDFAVAGAQRMQMLINDLLAYSRVGTGETSRVPISCEATLNAALANLTTALKEVGGQVTHDPLPVVDGNEMQLCRVFQNLVDNALKFHGPEPPRVHVSAQRGAGEWRFSVRDNGIGIEPEYAEQIFMIFRRLHTAAEYPGTGIGLAISKRIVERHGGRIWVESKLAQGATFWFTIADR